MNTAPHPPAEPIFSPVAFLLAWLWPGLGHISLGERKRGLLIMTGVLCLFLGGLFIGGVDVVDRRSDRLWFYAQAVCGPVAFGADWINQNYVKKLPDQDRNQLRSLGKVNEIGTLFCALAGLMNLIVILDALHYHPRSPTLTGESEPGRESRA